MGLDINTAYQQMLGNVSAVKGGVTGTSKKADAADPQTAGKTASPFGKGVEATFSGAGLAAAEKAKEIRAAGGTAAANEAKLSDKAKDYLKSLREKYGDYDFMVGDENDDLDDLLSGATKEFSVVFSNEELEKMAEDEDYAKEKMAGVEKAIDAAKKLAEEVGAGEEDENGILNGVFFNRFGITIGEDGKISIFADLERISAKQREEAEEARVARAEEKKEAEKEAEEAKAADGEGDGKTVNRDDYSVKLTRITAASAEELLEKFRGIDWDAVEEA